MFNHKLLIFATLAILFTLDNLQALPIQPQVRSKATGMEFVLVPAGSFEMGRANGFPSERPVHRVTFASSFYMGKYEVTQGQWRRVMNMTFRQHSKMVSSIHGWTVHGEGDTYPMYYVNWDDAQEFIRRMNALNDDYTYRLPSEAEWEYACRAKTTGDYPGNLDEMAWYEPNSNETTHPVGTKQPNGFGLYDMLGNVWEWCEDFHQDSYVGAPTDGSARLEGFYLSRRVFRGGSWAHDESYLRSSGRQGDVPHIRIKTLGFRVVAVPKRMPVQGPLNKK